MIEGVTSCRRAAHDDLAYSVWVDAPADVRLHRGIERDGESHRELWNRWMVEEAAFFRSDGTRERVNTIVSGQRHLSDERRAGTPEASG